MSGSRLRVRLLWLCTGMVLCTARGADVEWSGAATNNSAWTNNANWTGGAPPTNSDWAVFDLNTTRDPTIGGASRTLGGFKFLSGADDESIGGSGALTLLGISGQGVINSSGVAQTFAPSITLGSTQTWQTTGAGSDLTFNRPIDLAGYTLTIDSAANSTVNLSTGSGDLISSTGGGGALVKNGDGTLTIGNNANTFANGLTLNAGTISFKNNGSLGTGTLTLAGGTLNSTNNDKIIDNAVNLTGSVTINGDSGTDFTFTSNALDATGGQLTIANADVAPSGVVSVGFTGDALTFAGNIVVNDTASELRILNVSGTQTYSGDISGAGIVRQNAAGTAVLSGNNSFGGLVLDAGTLELANNSAAGSGTIDLSGGTLTSSSSRTLGNALQLSGISTITGGAGVDFTFTTNSVTTNSGSLALDNSADSGVMSLTFSGTDFAFAKAITFDDAFTELRSRNTTGTQTFSSSISGDGRIVHDTAGTLLLSGNNSALTGGVTLSAGTLQLGNSSALGAGTFSLQGGSVEAYDTARSSAAAIMLTGNATFAGANNLTFNGGLTQSGGNRTLTIANTGVTTFSTSDLILAGNNETNTLTLDIDGASGGVVINSVVRDGSGSGADGLIKSGAGSLALNGINTYSGSTTLDAGAVTFNNDNAFGTGTLVLNGGSLGLSADRTLANDVLLSGASSISGGSNSDLVFSSNTITTTGGSLAVSNTAGSGATTIGFSGSGFTFSDDVTLGDFTELRVLHASGTQLFSGTLSGSGSVRQDGSGTVTFSGNNSFSGGVTLNAGTFVADHDSALGGGTVTLHGGTLAATANRTFANALSLTGNSTIAADGGTAIVFTNSSISGTGGALTLQNSTGSGTAEIGFTGTDFDFTRAIALADANTQLRSGNASGTQTFSGGISGSGGIVHDAAGTLLLSGNNSGFDGSVTLSDGLLQIGSGSALGTGTFTLQGGTVEASGAARSSAAAVQLTGDATLAGTDNLTFTGGLTQTGGDHTLAITNTGVTTFSTQPLVLAENDQARTLTLDVAGTSGGLAINSSITDGSGTGHDGLIKAGAGQLTLSDSNTFTGAVAVNGGTLVAGGTTNLGGFAALGDHSWVTSPTTVISVADGATLSLSSSLTSGGGNGVTTQYQTLELAGSGVGGAGALHITGGVNTWTGNIALTGDTLINNTGSNTFYIGPYAISPPTDIKLDGHALTFTGSSGAYISSSIGNSAGDTGSLTVDLTDSSSTIAFGGVQNSYTGATTVKNGNLRLAINPGVHPNAAILGALTIGDGVGLADTAVVKNNYNDQIADDVAVTINSDGLLDLGSYGKDDVIGDLTLNGGHIKTTGANNGNLYLGGDVWVGNAATSKVDGHAVSGGLNLNNIGGPARTFTIDTGSTLEVNAVLSGGSFIKEGDGTMKLTRANTFGYAGTTEVKNGILNIQDSDALGQHGSSLADKGTIVSSGATLQLENTVGNVTVGAEALTLNGSGFTGLGALNSKSGTNSWAGLVTLGSDATINVDSGSTFTVTGGVTGTAGTGVTQTLTVTGAGDTTIGSAIYDNRDDVAPLHPDLHTGTVALTKNGAGTLTLSGNNSFTGAIAINAGKIDVIANDVLGAHTNAVSVAGSAEFSLSGGGGNTNTIGSLTGTGLTSIAASTTLKVDHAAANTYDGRLSGDGLFQKIGAETFTFSSSANTSAFNFSGTVQVDAGTMEFQGGSSGSALTIGTLTLLGGTTVYLDASYINVGTLQINGDTILDFGTGGASVLNAQNIYIAAGATVTVRNWTSEIDFLFARADFRRDNNSGALAIYNAIGAAPENQVAFEDDPESPDGSQTTWINDYGAYTDWEIRPIPEPRVYGALMIGSVLGLILWRRRRRAAQLTASLNHKEQELGWTT